ncbi:hypothetical protein AcV5_007668 [Taiwanofungus camphoratus]|nr:hypothetical protein AcV5_007668 [Antrodia cinnamomea]
MQQKPSASVTLDVIAAGHGSPLHRLSAALMSHAMGPDLQHRHARTHVHLPPFNRVQPRQSGTLAPLGCSATP